MPITTTIGPMIDQVVVLLIGLPPTTPKPCRAHSRPNNATNTPRTPMAMRMRPLWARCGPSCPRVRPPWRSPIRHDGGDAIHGEEFDREHNIRAACAGLFPDGCGARTNRTGAAAGPRLPRAPAGLRHDVGSVRVGGAVLPAVLHPARGRPSRVTSGREPCAEGAARPVADVRVGWGRADL